MMESAGGPRRSALEIAGPWLLLGLFVWVGFLALSPPCALPANAPATSFSAARARVHVERIARAPHPVGSPEIAVVRRVLIGELERLGLQPERQSFMAPDFYGPGGLVEVVNVLARIPGSSPGPTTLLMAHYDTVPTTPGASDDSAAVAALLETARALLAGPPPRCDVLILFTDGEEPAPRYGSNAFRAHHPAAREIGFVLNLEAVGGCGPSMLIETSGPGASVVAAWSDAVPRPVGFSFVHEVVTRLGDVGTDFDGFRRAGVPGVHLAWLRDSPIYHSPADDLEALSPRSLQHHGDQALGIARGVERQRPGARDDPSVYFTLGPFFVQHPAGWSLAPALLAALLLGLALRRARTTPVAVVLGCGRLLLAALAATVAATVAWMLIASVRTTPSVLESTAWLVALIALAAFVARWVTGGLRGDARAFAAAALWLVLACLTVLATPGASYLFVWPALAAAAVLLAGRARERTLLGFAVVTFPAVILAVPVVDFFFLMGQPRPGNPDSSMPAAAAVAFLHAALVTALLRGMWPAVRESRA